MTEEQMLVLVKHTATTASSNAFRYLLSTTNINRVRLAKICSAAGDKFAQSLIQDLKASEIGRVP